jgi:chemotaxis signal transduction protein
MSEGEAQAKQEVDLLLFHVGKATYGADASQVLRVDNAAANALVLSELGTLEQGSRALVFSTDEGEGQLRIDSVGGVRTVDIMDLRRLPPAATVQPYALGVWLDGTQSVLLIDLQEAAKSKTFQKKART